MGMSKDEKTIYKLRRNYLAATRANTVTEWKKYVLSCLRANVLPPVARGLDFMEFVESIRDNVFETTIESEEIENEHE